MASLNRFVFDPKASQLTVHAFASGLASVVAHNPKFAIQEFSGEAKFQSGTLAQAAVRMDIKVGSMALMDEVSEYDRREIQRVTFEEVLESESFPRIEFQSSQVIVTKVSENLYKAAITGDLTLHGVTNAQRFEAQVVAGEDSLRGYGNFAVKQTSFGIRIASIANGTLKMKDELKIAFFIIARKEG